MCDEMKKGAPVWRIMILLLIVAKFSFVIAALVVAAELKTLMNQGIGKLSVACEDASGQAHCKEVAAECEKYVDIAFLAIMIVIGIFAFFDLIGCLGAGRGSTFILCIYNIVTVVFIILLIIPFGASIGVSKMSGDKNNELVLKFHEFVNQSMDTLREHVDKMVKDPQGIKSGTQLLNITKEQKQIFLDFDAAGIPIDWVLKKDDLDKLNTIEMKIRNITQGYSKKIRSVQEAFDWIQQKFECCGVVSYTDWDQYSMRGLLGRFHNDSELHPLFIRFTGKGDKTEYTWEQECVFQEKPKVAYECYVPTSCCKDNTSVQCNKMKATIQPDEPRDILDPDRIYTTSCSDALVNKIHTVTRNLSIILGCMLLLLVISLICSCIARKQLLRADQTEADAVAKIKDKDPLHFENQYVPPPSPAADSTPATNQAAASSYP